MRGTFLLLTVFVVLFIGCKKDCIPENAVCQETVPQNELCLAYFERYFFSPKENKCQLKAYSGCSQRGFATLKECELCKCN